jgi:glycosyltransferase involved in cell wall biosynthesis
MILQPASTARGYATGPRGYLPRTTVTERIAELAAPGGDAAGVLYVIDRLTQRTAGTEGQLHLLVEALLARGIPCHLLVLQSSDYLEREGFPCAWSSLESPSLAAPSTWTRMLAAGRRFRAQGFRIAHVFFNDASVVAPPMLRLAGLRTIISRRDMGFWYTPAYRWMLRVTGRFVDRCIANSQAVSDVTGQAEWLAPSVRTVIYNGIAGVPDTGDVPEPLASLRAQGRILAGVVANARPVKRLEDLVEALHRCAAAQPALDAVFIGGGDMAPVRARAARLGLDDRVHFLGRRADTDAVLRGLHIGVLCSESEGFSNALLEYMRAGLPAVCTDAGGNGEAVDHGRTGHLYRVGDVDALARHLATLAHDPQLRERLGRAAREVARDRFGLQPMVDAHLALYGELAPEVLA